MNPSNTQVTPEIKKVIDSNGDGHTVIPTPHTHDQSEVRGLTTALAAKADTSTVNAALNGKASVAQVNAKASKVSGAVSGHFAGLDSNGDLTDSGVSAASFSNRVAAGTNGSIIVADASGTIGRSPKTIADLMPATTIDSTPTLNSTNLVTSGGVYSALLGKASTAQLSGKEDKPLPLGIHCNDDTAELYPDDRDELYDVITEVQSKLVMSTSNPKPVHVLIVLSYFDQQANLMYKCAVNGEMAIWTSGNNVHLSIIIGKSIYVMNGTYSIIEDQGQAECEVTISDETFYFENSI